MAGSERVAVVGLAGRYPGVGADLDAYWDAVAGARDLGREVPPGRWVLPPGECTAPDSVDSARGYFLDPFEPDLSGLDVPGEWLSTLDPLFHLVLDVGNRAWLSARTAGLDRRKVAVVLGNIYLPTEGASNFARSILAPRRNRSGFGSGEVQLANPLNLRAAALPAGILAKALGLGGGSFTLDAACATSLYALKFACDELLSGRADCVLAGGASRPDPLYTQMGFSRLKALSGTGTCSPFDAAANGLVVGEGAGIFVLKRLSDALRHGDTVHGVICGVGLSNDVAGNLLAPASEGQLRAMRGAYERAGWQASAPDVIECHATGTPVGDAVEFAGLRQLWGESGWSPGQCAIGSVKSTVGHLLTGAGAAALTKVLLAMRAKLLPPQANFHSANPSLGYDGGPFRVLSSPEPWAPKRPTLPRRAAVSGFGFGGVNAHLLVEEYVGQTYAAPAPPRAQPPAGVPLPALTTTGSKSRLMSRINAILSSGSGAVAPPRPRAAPAAPKVAAPEAPAVAVVGVAARTDRADSARHFQELALGRAGGAGPAPGLGELAVPLDRFRIPPKELADALPQQVLMLVVAAEAMDDCAAKPPEVPTEGDPRSGVFVGLSLDPNTTNFHLRWAAKAAGSDPDAVSPPLTADRVVGHLGSIAASRVARAFRFGGPSISVSGEESSGLQALRLAVRALQSNELDRAVVGAVEFALDPRSRAATRHWRPESDDAAPLAATSGGAAGGEGAVALVLKRLADAERDGDRVYAVLRGIGQAGGGAVTGSAPDAPAVATSLVRACAEANADPATVDYYESAATGVPADDAPEAEALAAVLQSKPRAVPLVVSAARGQFGDLGAASGLAGVLKAALALYQQVLPPGVDCAGLRPPLAGRAGLADSPSARYWLANRADGPRRAVVAARGVDGSSLHALLEEFAPVAEVPPSAAELRGRERRQPLGARADGVFALEADSVPALPNHLERLQGYARSRSSQPIEVVAREWHESAPPAPQLPLAACLVARSVAELVEQLDALREHLVRAPKERFAHESRPGFRDRVFYNPSPLGPRGKVAFVFPGSGSHFAGMGQQLGVAFPDALRAQQDENRRLRDQFRPELFWARSVPESATPRELLFGQVAHGTLASDVVRGLGIEPQVLVGVSLGESAGLFGLRIWRDRDEMLSRLEKSSLFESDLAPPYRAAQRHWGWPDSQPVNWLAGVLAVPADDVMAALRPGLRVYLLIATTRSECVVGGVRGDVERLAAQFPQAAFLPLPGVTLAHCEAAKPVEKPYRELHTLPVSAARVTVFSGAAARPYAPSPGACADSITAGVLGTIDFPAVVEAAYRDGARIFLEMGPGNSASRAISSVLGDRPHVARSVSAARQDESSLVLRALAQCVSERTGAGLGALYGPAVKLAARPALAAPTARVLKLPARTVPESLFALPPAPVPTPMPVPPAAAISAASGAFEAVPSPVEPEPAVTAPEATANGYHPAPSETELDRLPVEVSAEPTAEPLVATPPPAPRSRLVSALLGDDDEDDGGSDWLPELVAEVEAALEVEVAPATDPDAPPRRLDTDALFAFARGPVAPVLGPLYAGIDEFPTRVRLPDGPLMLVDEVLDIEGEPLSLGAGRVVTTHAVYAERWYLDQGRCPISVTVEAGQADLFLAGFLGIDFQTRGLAVYRLLDAVVTFHRGLPEVGEVIRYDIKIDRFVQQSGAWLFHFRFEGTIGGRPLLTMENGVAGFFTAEHLAAGQGVVKSRLDTMPLPGKRPDGFRWPVEHGKSALTEMDIEALHRGDLAGAFGSPFELARVAAPTRLPSGMLRLLDRVTALEPAGGRFGLGFVRGEYDIQPAEWFIECHFVDDQVMPGTLMYECCLQTLRVLVARLGWVGEANKVVAEPKPGVKSRLKCRGQVLATTGTVAYEVSVKEVGFGPEPYCIADALMFADGKPIVEITNLSLRLGGLVEADIAEVWADLDADAPPTEPLPAPAFSHAQVVAYSNGNPSECFGEPYRVFDHERVLARLPGPPFQFVDCVRRVEGEPFVMKAGARAVAEYNPPVDAWYFEAERSGRMPMSVLLEAALQPCGFLAAYCGSALQVPFDVSFRNLGGKATQHLAVTPKVGRLTSTATLTKVSNSAGMIIQHYDLLIESRKGKVFDGTTYFGFFAKDALANQVGMVSAKVPYLSAEQSAHPSLIRGTLPRESPFPAEQLRMLDRIDGYLPTGGAFGLGVAQGRIAVDPSAWFFAAHFHQDPVWPGSLGLESFVQLLKFAYVNRFGADAHPSGAGFQFPQLGTPYDWEYRGQVVPGDREVTVVLEVTAIDEAARAITARGFLTIDGRVIYKMANFTLS